MEKKEGAKEKKGEDKKQEDEEGKYKKLEKQGREQSPNVVAAAGLLPLLLAQVGQVPRRATHALAFL